MGKTSEKVPLKPKALGVNGVELNDISCVSCKKHKKILKDGQFHCKYCGVLCEECSADHQKSPKQTGHWAQKLQLVSQYYPSTTPTFHHVGKCEAHPKHHIKGYCLDHGALVCKICAKTEHPQCMIEDLDTMSEGFSRDKHMIEGRHELTDLRRRCKMARKSKQGELIHMAKQAEAFENYVRKIREKIKVLFDDMLTAILKEKDAFCKEEGTLIEKDASACAYIEPILDKVNETLDEAFRNGKQTEQWVALKKLEHVITHFEEVITKIENDRSEVKFEFIPNKSLQGLLEAPENVGKMKVTSSRLYGNNTDIVAPKIIEPSKKASLFRNPFAKKSDNTNPNPWDKSTHLHSKSTPLPSVTPRGKSSWQQDGTTTADRKTPKGTSLVRSDTGLYVPKDSKTSLTGAKNANMHNSSSKVHGQPFGPTKQIKLTYIGRKEIMTQQDPELPSITGSTFLPNGRLVLVDNHNKTLKLYSADFELLAIAGLSERPWNVTHCYKTVVAVSYPYDRSVEIIATGREMNIETKIRTDRICHGMAFHKVEKWLYVACGQGNDAQIQAYCLDGHLRKVIIPKEGVLHEPCYLVMSPDSTRMYLSDLDNGVIGLNTKTGDIICHYKDPRIKRYWDLKLDADGRVFVLTTGPESLFVLMGDHNGQLVKEFNVGNKPCSLAYSPVNHDLVITRWTVEDIEVFRFL